MELNIKAQSSYDTYERECRFCNVYNDQEFIDKYWAEYPNTIYNISFYAISAAALIGTVCFVYFHSHKQPSQLPMPIPAVANIIPPAVMILSQAGTAAAKVINDTFTVDFSGEIAISEDSI
jgi:hypothetical protein